MIQTLHNVLGSFGVLAILAWSASVGAVLAWALRWRLGPGLGALGAGACGALVLLALHGGVAVLALLGALAGLGGGLALTFRPGQAPRSRPVTLALGLALAGLLAEGANRSFYIAWVRLDESEQREAEARREEEQRQKLLEARKDEVASVRYAEDTEEDRLDLAGLKEEEHANIYEAAAKTGQVDVPEYRRGGPKERSPEAKGEGEYLESVKEAQAGDEEAQKEDESNYYMLAPEQYTTALRLVPWNRQVAEYVLWLALLVLVIDYLRRFNGPLANVPPLPVGGAWLDTLAPGDRILWFPEASGELITWYMERIPRRGESWIALGLTGGAAEVPAVPRVRAGSHDFVQVPHFLWPRDVEGDAEFALESAWFGRACVTAPDPGESERLLDALFHFLDYRVQTRAHARRAVHVVWAPAEVPDEARVRRLAEACRACNLRLVVVGPGREPVAPACFDRLWRETPAPPEPSRGVRGLAWAIGWSVDYGWRFACWLAPRARVAVSWVKARALALAERLPKLPEPPEPAVAGAGGVAAAGRRTANADKKRRRGKRRPAPAPSSPAAATAAPPLPEAPSEEAPPPEPAAPTPEAPAPEPFDTPASTPAGAPPAPAPTPEPAPETESGAAGAVASEAVSAEPGTPEAVAPEDQEDQEAAGDAAGAAPFEAAEPGAPGAGAATGSPSAEEASRQVQETPEEEALPEEEETPEAASELAALAEATGGAPPEGPDLPPEPEVGEPTSVAFKNGLLTYRCPACQKRLGVKPPKAGGEMNCPECAARMRIPDLPLLEPGPPKFKQGLLTFRCPACEKRLGVKPAKAGGEMSCPECAARLKVPDRPVLDPTSVKWKSGMLTFRCAACEKRIGVKPERSGAEMDCPSCAARLNVPEPPPGEPAPFEAKAGGQEGEAARFEAPAAPPSLDEPVAPEAPEEPDPDDPVAALAALASGETPAPKQAQAPQTPPGEERITFSCPDCRRTLGAKKKAAGRGLNCPNCGKRVQVPGGGPRRADPKDKLVIRCYHCSKRIGVRPEWAGRKVECPGCGEHTRVPDKPAGLARKRLGEDGKVDTDRIRAQCEHCGAVLSADKKHAGHRYPCPSCQYPILVPQPDA